MIALLRYGTGMPFNAYAPWPEGHDIAESTVSEDWRLARVWLARELRAREA